MQDMSWIHNPAFKNIHHKKLEIITQLIQNTDGKPIAQSIPFLMQANKELHMEGLSFSEEETSLIMDILTKDMSASEKESIAKMKGLIHQKMKKKE
ncbi:MAG: hypothetical protein ACERKN_00350 [Velocimicrobium sp.]